MLNPCIMDYIDDIIIEFQNYNLSILKMALQPQKVSPTELVRLLSQINQIWGHIFDFKTIGPTWVNIWPIL